MSSVSLFILIQTALGCDIVLKEKATVNSNNITIKEIASRYPANLKDIVIAPAPFANNSITLTKAFISFTLKQKGIKATVCGSKTVKISAETITLKASDIQRIIGKNLTIVSHLPILLPAGSYKFKVVSVSHSTKFTFYTIQAIKNGKFQRTINITALREQTTRLIPVAKRDIEVGQIITASDITFAKLSGIAPNTFTNKSYIVNRIATNFIPKGSTFSTANTRRFKPVKMGDLVSVEVVAGRIRITTVAKALKGGYKGDIIPIMYLSSKKIMPAVITGKKQVIVQ